MMKDTSGGAGYVPRRGNPEQRCEPCAPVAGANESVIDSNLESKVEEGICPPGRGERCSYFWFWEKIAKQT
jgi:hypothetical protein